MRTCNCPNCSAALSFSDDREFGFCEYCGSKIMFDDFRSTQRIVDEAKIKQAETDRMVRMRELEIAERQDSEGKKLKSILTIVWLIISLIILSICIVEIAFKDDFVTGFLILIYIGGPVIGGGAYLVFKVLPEKENDRRLLKSGGIRFPKDIVPFSDKNFEAIQAELKNAGFREINCVNLHDVRLGLLQKPGKVESITVNGENIISGGKVYLPDDPVIITYHGK